MGVSADPPSDEDRRLEVVFRSAAEWEAHIEALRADMRHFAAEAALLSPLPRLHHLTALRAAVNHEGRQAWLAAILAAHRSGRGLRDIGRAAGLSHEQIRRLLASAAGPASAGPADQRQGRLSHNVTLSGGHDPK